MIICYDNLSQTWKKNGIKFFSPWMNFQKTYLSNLEAQNLISLIEEEEQRWNSNFVISLLTVWKKGTFSLTWKNISWKHLAM